MRSQRLKIFVKRGLGTLSSTNYLSVCIYTCIACWYNLYDETSCSSNVTAKLIIIRIYHKIEIRMGLKVDELLAWFPYGITNNVDRPFTHRRFNVLTGWVSLAVTCVHYAPVASVER